MSITKQEQAKLEQEGKEIAICLMMLPAILAFVIFMLFIGIVSLK